MSLPTAAFARASLKVWQARRRRYQRLLKKANGRIALREGQLAKIRETLAHPTVMFDAVNLANIPAGADAVAGYTAGHFPTFPELPKRWPHAKHLSIAVASRYDAECLDVEPGDATPEVAAAWVKRQRARGVKRPVLYCSVSAVPGLLGALAKAGIGRDDIRLWTAHYTHKAHRCGPTCGFGMRTTADATQWTDKALGRSLDQSLVGAGFWN